MQKFNYHSHTYRCGHADQDYKDEDYIRDYIKMKFEKITFKDHCPEKEKIDKRENIRMDFEQKDEYLESIKQLKKKYSGIIEIESGYEVEFLPGEEKNLIELKKDVDKIILGQHFIYDKEKKLKVFGKKEFLDDEIIMYGKYIEKAIELGIPNIIAHPDIYMLNREHFGEVESKVANLICKNAQRKNIPLEINLNNVFINTYYKNKKLNYDSKKIQRERMKQVFYPCKDFWNIVSKYNIKVLYGIDAHHRGQIQLFNKLVELANEKIGLEIIRKLNFLEK